MGAVATVWPAGMRAAACGRLVAAGAAAVEAGPAIVTALLRGRRGGTGMLFTRRISAW